MPYFQQFTGSGSFIVPEGMTELTNVDGWAAGNTGDNGSGGTIGVIAGAKGGQAGSTGNISSYPVTPGQEIFYDADGGQFDGDFFCDIGGEEGEQPVSPQLDGGKGGDSDGGGTGGAGAPFFPPAPASEGNFPGGGGGGGASYDVSDPPAEIFTDGAHGGQGLIEVTGGTQTPNAPTNPTILAKTNTTITVGWDDNSGIADSYTIEYADNSGFTGSSLAFAGGDDTSKVITGLTPLTQYWFRVRADYSPDSTHSAYTSSVNDTTFPNPPTAPSLMSATTISQTQIDLTWQDNSSNEVDFELQRATDAGFTTNLVTTFPAAGVQSDSATGLTANTQYFFRIRARNTGGNSAFSNTDDATTLPNAPTAPSLMSATAVSTSQINLTWQDNSGNEDDFELLQAKDNGFSVDLVTTHPAAGVQAATASGLDPETEYFFKIRARNTGGNSAFSNTDSDTTFAEVTTRPSNVIGCGLI